MNSSETKQNSNFHKWNFDSYFMEDAEPRLRALFGHTVKGNDVDYRSPLFDGKPREDVLGAWNKILIPKLSGMEGLLEFENDLRGKVGPLSIQKPLSERLDDVKAYYEEIHLSSKPISSNAINKVLKDWAPKVGGLRVRSPLSTWENMKKSTSAGNPTMGKKHEAFDLYGLPEIINGKISINGQLFEPSAILGWRGQEGGIEPDDVKQRIIWMFPFGINLAELRFYQPFKEAMQKFNFVPAWNGNDKVDESMTQLFRTKGKHDNIVCTDFTKFDQHFNVHMQECARAILSSLTTPQDRWWFDQIFPIKYNIPLILDWSAQTTGEHGMGSGSGGTNDDETVSHKALQEECAEVHNSTLNPYSMDLGDDGCLSFPGIDVNAVLSTYPTHGQEMNESKQMVSTSEAVYLRRWYHEDYLVDGINRGVYSTNRALGKLMGYERIHNPDEWSAKMEIIRDLSIIENVKWHPLKEEFLDFCIKGDDYRLGLSIPGFFNELGTFYESSELAQSFKSYTAGDGTDIMSWWVVRSLMTRA